MGLYDAVDRGGAGRKKEKTLRRPLLIAAALYLAMVMFSSSLVTRLERRLRGSER